MEVRPANLQVYLIIMQSISAHMASSTQLLKVKVLWPLLLQATLRGIYNCLSQLEINKQDFAWSKGKVGRSPEA